jgi:hypothetical protein
MKQTQIYLTNEERKALRLIAERLDQSQSEIIRGAVDRYVARFQSENRLDLLRRARGMWKDRTDLPDFQILRGELDRYTDTNE